MLKEKLRRYNDDWALTSYKIRVERANNCCEICGVKHKSIIKRAKNGEFRYAYADEIKLIEYLQNQCKLKFMKAVKDCGLTFVILTVAHMNHNERDDRPENLKALCQRDHLMHDKRDNIYRAQEQKRIKSGQLQLIPRHWQEIYD